MEEISMSKLEALMRDRLAEIGSPLPFTIIQTVKDYAGCNWRVAVGPVTDGQSLEGHSAACTTARRELSEDYNLEPERKESET